MPGLSQHTVEQVVASVASATPAPGGGASAALACALAAALLEMATASSQDGAGARRMRDLRDRAGAVRAHALRLADDDAAAYGEVIAAQRLPATDGSRARRVTLALSRASDAPLALACEAAALTEMTAEVVAQGNPALRGDALAGGLLAEAVAAAAARLVEINLAGAPGDPRVEDARALAARAQAARERALHA